MFQVICTNLLSSFKYSTRGHLWISIGYLLMAIMSSFAIAETPNPIGNAQLTRLQWQQDLDALDTDIRQYHINPFWYKDEAGYKRLYQQAHKYIANAKPIDVAVINGHFEKMVAYISDGHSYVVNKTARFGSFPYRLEWFAHDLFIVSIEQEYKHLLGAKVLAFDGMNIKQANKHIAPFIPIVNPSGFKSESKDAYQFAGLLHVGGITKQADRVELMLELQNGQKIKQVFRLYQNKTALVDIQEHQDAPIPLYRQQRDSNQWFIFLEKERAIYLRYASVVEKNKDDIKNLAAKITQLIDSHNVQKLIVDVRDNGGGDSYFNAPLINAIARNKSINERGKLFVLTNHNTFSAAINFTGNMEIKTRAIFVGEKVGDRATFAGESGPQAKHVLPNSGIVVSLSFSEWNSTYDNDLRDAVGLNIPIKLTMQDFLFGRDPVLQACLDYVSEEIKSAKFNDANYSSWIGRYDYSPDKALKIYTNNGELHMEITELAFSSLYSAGKNKLTTDFSGIQLKRLPGGDIELIQAGSKNRVLHKLPDHQLKALELLMADKFDDAKNSYRRIYDENPKLLSVRGNSLGILAAHIRARYNNQKHYDQLREIAESLYGTSIPSWDLDE